MALLLLVLLLQQLHHGATYRSIRQARYRIDCSRHRWCLPMARMHWRKSWYIMEMGEAVWRDGCGSRSMATMCYVEACVRTSMAALHAPAWSRGKLPFTAHDNKRKQNVLTTSLQQTMHRRGVGAGHTWLGWGRLACCVHLIVGFGL